MVWGLEKNFWKLRKKKSQSRIMDDNNGWGVNLISHYYLFLKKIKKGLPCIFSYEYW